MEATASLPLTAKFLTQQSWDKISAGKLVVAPSTKIENGFVVIKSLDDGMTRTKSGKILVEGTHVGNFTVNQNGKKSEITNFSDKNCVPGPVYHLFAEEKISVLKNKKVLLEFFSKGL